ncbi:MAG: hypothetical protein DSO09_04470 [Candidatus Methanomethylicota archaeon]|jgi:uncharacterized membrane protein (DUF106 family)|uniref:DUF106 domain-containing protein n=1 Tax=Thermoproteota archaeon TaxID=2056631 RepID=A0A520KED0_9CREN|nr:MAG: DUF106 domain-containing protein [Candidatus Verstraetearchaeota archaeon]TDA38412.1 MAG: hypothetical protein DSO09_04470 [Candidatus Verstraetearchaeota archaeon]
MVFESLLEFYNSIVMFLSAMLGPAKNFPLSSLTILLMSIIMLLISSIVTRKFTDVEKTRRIMIQVKEWQDAYMKAVREKDNKQIEKLKKKEAVIKKLQAEIMREQFKPLMFTLIPFMIIFYLFLGVFGYNQVVVAESPLTIPFLGNKFTFWIWYLITTFAFSSLIQRLFNLPSVQD